MLRAMVAGDPSQTTPVATAVASVLCANESICKLTAWNVQCVLRKYNKHKLTQRE